MSGRILAATFEPSRACQRPSTLWLSLCALVAMPLGSLACGIDVVGAQDVPASGATAARDAGGGAHDSASGARPSGDAAPQGTSGVVEAGILSDAAVCVARGGACRSQADCCPGLECDDPEKDGECEAPKD